MKYTIFSIDGITTKETNMKHEFDILDIQFNAAVMTLAAKVLIGRYDNYDTTEVPEEVDSLEKITEHYLRTGRVKIWIGNSNNTIFGDPAINHSFRAWHDYVHINKQYPFTTEGEACTYAEQSRQLYEQYGFNGRSIKWDKYLWIEIIGQLRYKDAYGDFPDDQIKFTRNFIETMK